jgi:lipopolysaccharide transport system permease protein
MQIARIGVLLVSFITVLRNHNALIVDLARREVGERYAGQILGKIWPVVHPLMLMAVYVFIFSVVFKTKIASEYQMPLDYTAYILSGLVPWLAFQEVMAKSSSLIVANSNLVKQVVFPVEVLPLKGVLSSLLPFAVSMFVLITYVLLSFGGLPWTYVLLPILVFFQVLLMIGVAFLFSAAGAYFRDLKDFVQVFTIMNLYLMPVFYLPMWVPSLFKPILYVNPFSYMIWCYQDALYYGGIEHPWAWGVFGIGSTIVFFTGYYLFIKFKTVFGDVL